MSGPQKPNYFLIWAIWGSVRAYFPILSYYLGVPPGSPIGPYWLLLAHVGPAAVAKPLDILANFASASLPLHETPLTRA